MTTMTSWIVLFATILGNGIAAHAEWSPIPPPHPASDTARYFCQGFVRTENAYCHTSAGADYAFTYRSALQECRFFHPDRDDECQVTCRRLR